MDNINRVLKASRNQIQTISNRSSKINILKKIDLLGQFDFQNLIITLDYYSSQEVNHILTSGNYEDKSELLPLLIHEYTHFIDTTSTIWGLNHLYLMQNAYDIDYTSHGNERLFFHGKIFFDYLKRIKLPDYYNQIGVIESDSSDWLKQHSIGLLFSINGYPSDNPVIFTNFHDSENNLIARSPFSELSLLECSATYQEIKYKLALLEKESDEFSTVELVKIRRDLEKSFFNNQLTEYSVCTHLALDKIIKKDLLFSLEIASHISRFCLNASSATFEDVRRTKNFQRILNYDDRSLKRFNSALKNKNRGVLFFTIIMSMDLILKNEFNYFLSSFESALRRLGINKDHLSHTITEAENILTKINNGKNSLIKTVANCGFANLRKSSGKYSSIEFYEMNLPPCYLNDGTQFNPFFSEKNHLSQIDCDYFFDQFNSCERAVYRFVEGCTN